MALLLHISDMHFEQSIDCLDEHITKIAASLNPLKPFSKVIIIISGDLTKQGEFFEFKAVNYFVKRLVSTIESTHCIPQNNIVVYCVPGNHDVQHEKDGYMTHSDLESIYSEQEYEIELAKEIEKLKHFYNFANKINCFNNDPLCHKKEIEIYNKKVSFYLINSAVFSLRNEEDKGLHYLTDKALNDLDLADSDINIAVMHHSPHCYTDQIKNRLTEILSNRFSLLLTGHEHYEADEVAGLKTGAFDVFRAGALYDKGWNNSEYSVFKINEKLSVKKYVYLWNERSNQYEKKGERKNITLISKNKNSICKISDDFCDIIKKDERKDIANSFEEYFVFPRMEYIDYDQQNKSKDIKTEQAFENEIEKSKFIYISGNHGLGKTTLLKHVFNKLSVDHLPLFLSVDDFTKKSSDRIIKNVFEAIYGDDSSIYESFRQMSSDKKALLIDDVDRINRNDFNFFIKSVKDEFDIIILTSTEKIEFDWKDRLDSNFDYRENFVHLKLTPLFKDKRRELVSSLVPLLKSKSANENDLINVLCDTLDSQKRFVFMTPDFIIQYVDYFCKNIGDISSYDTNVFSKVFEANLTNALTPHASGKLNVDKMFALLAKISYISNSHKEYPIKEKTITDCINEYNSEYDNSIDATDFIKSCEKAKVIYKTDDGYRFTSKNYYAYFIAYEILFKYNETDDRRDIYSIINYCCFGINSDILLFIIYLSDKPAILQIIITMIHELTDDWSEYDGKSVDLKYLSAPAKTKKEFKEKNPDAVLLEQVAQEQISDDIRDIQTLDIYDYDEQTVDEVLNKVVKATSLLNLLSRAFPNFEHRIKSDQKKEIVELLYTLPNKIFYFWAKELDADSDGFITYFLQKYDDEYMKDNREFSFDKAISESIASMQNMSLSLLLDLYYGVVHESCKTNTFDFLERFKHDIKWTYQSEYMLMVERYKRDVNTLIALADKQMGKDFVQDDIAKRILYHAINTMPNLSVSQKDKLSSRIGLKKEKVKEIGINRHRGAIDN